MTPKGWTKSERTGARGITLATFERQDGFWRVGEVAHNTARPFYVQWSGNTPRGHWACTAQFRSRFATPEAAMKAVDRKFPMED